MTEKCVAPDAVREAAAGVSMRSGMSRRAASAGRGGVQTYTVAAAVAVLSVAAGCTSDGSPGYAQAGLQRPTIAFESIDGPPAPVFEKLVSDLAAEARSRQVQVVSRQSTASYRVRGYLAANVVEGWTHYEWVWDVYDADKHRAARVGGEERGGRPGDGWASLDDFTLSRIAHASIDQLVAFLGSPDATQPRGGPTTGLADAGEEAPGLGTGYASSTPTAAIR
jgi:hypothetical protein